MISFVMKAVCDVDVDAMLTIEDEVVKREARSLLIITFKTFIASTENFTLLLPNCNYNNKCTYTRGLTIPFFGPFEAFSPKFSTVGQNHNHGFLRVTVTVWLAWQRGLPAHSAATKARRVEKRSPKEV